MTPEPLVLDASVGVKWLRNESGSDAARRLLADHAEGTVRLVVPVIFVHEVLDVARRLYGIARARTLWEHLERAEITVVGLDSQLIRETLETAEQLGCTFYDAAAPALAARIGVALVSADRRAHAAVDGARLLGQ